MCAEEELSKVGQGVGDVHLRSMLLVVYLSLQLLHLCNLSGVLHHLQDSSV